MDTNFMDTSHISVRDPSYVAGTAQKPEVGVFIQTNRKARAINENKLSVGQTVWMKWSGGPIVASSRILSWHTGNFHSGNINQIRELCLGTNLFGLTDYWKEVSGKIDGYYAVILLSDEHWLEQPIFSNGRSHGSSWIYLDTAEKRDTWLTNDVVQQGKDKHPKGRAIPKGMRFDVLKRDNYTCMYCGSKAPEVTLHVDHIIPWTLVKKHEIKNLVTACSACNQGKSAKII